MVVGALRLFAPLLVGFLLISCGDGDQQPSPQTSTTPEIELSENPVLGQDALVWVYDDASVENGATCLSLLDELVPVTERTKVEAKRATCHVTGQEALSLNFLSDSSQTLYIGSVQVILLSDIALPLATLTSSSGAQELPMCRDHLANLHLSTRHPEEALWRSACMILPPLKGAPLQTTQVVWATVPEASQVGPDEILPCWLLPKYMELSPSNDAKDVRCSL